MGFAVLDPVVVFGIQTYQAYQLLVIGQADQGHALGIAADLGNLGRTRAHERALVGDQHQLVLFADLHGTDQVAIALGALDADHALVAPALARVFGKLGALAVAALGRGEDVAIAIAHDQADHLLALGQADAAHATRRATGRAHGILVETHGL